MKKLSPIGGQKTVTAAGTAEAISATELRAIVVIFQAKVGNTGAVHIGDSSVHNSTSPQITLDAGESVTIDAPVGLYIDLNEWFIDVGTSGEGIDYVIGV